MSTGGGRTITHVFCDNDKFCQAVLRKHWPESEIYDDIKKITADTYGKGLQRRRLGGKTGRSESTERPFILTGGFPCQPFSAAGLRRGTADDRHLWPEMLRVIRLTEPEWVIAENVGGILSWNGGLVFEQVCADLEAAGYTVQPFVIPAVAVNAPHRRDRVWFVAHAIGGPDRGGTGKDGRPQKEERLQERDEVGQPSEPGTLHAANSDGHRSQKSRSKFQASGYRQFDEATWGADWSEVAAELCSVDDGLPARMGGLELTKAQHRKEQLKAYGNAIVPQVAMEIIRAMV